MESSIRQQIYIGGCQRSGTTLLGAMLGAHSNCVCTPESQFKIDVLRSIKISKTIHSPESILSRVIRNWRYKVWALKLASESDPFEEIGGTYASVIKWVVKKYGEKIGKPHAKIWVDHTPNNLKFALELLKIFPETKMVHIVRDGRGIAASVIPLDWGPNTIARAASWWVDRVAYGLAAEIALGDSRIRRVKYEELVMNPEATIKSLCSFLDLEFQEQMLMGRGFLVPQYSRSQHRLVGTAPDSSRASAWETELTPRQIEIFEFLTSDFLSFLGYQMQYGMKAKGMTKFERVRMEIRERVQQLNNRLKRRLVRMRKMEVHK